MIEALSSKLAIAIKNASGNEQASVDVIRFSLVVILNTTVTILLCVLFGIITGNLSEVMLALVSFAALRMVSGGFHLKTPASCITLSVFTMVVIPFIPLTTPIIVFMTCASILLVLIFAPSNIEKQTRVPEKYFFAFKIIGVLITSANLFFLVDVFALSFFIQSLSLIRKRR